jgi:hypothetical protein
MKKKAKPQYEKELSPEVIQVLREVAPDYLEDYDDVEEFLKEWFREGDAEEIRRILSYSRDIWNRIERGEDIPVPDWNPDPDSPMITRLWEIAKGAEADTSTPEERQRWAEEINRKAAEQGKLLTDDVWEGITGPWIFIPASGLGESEREEEDDDEERGADAE